MRAAAIVAAGLALAVGALFARAAASRAPAVVPAWDPVAEAAASVGRVENAEATVPPPCYTRTDGASNPCWVCHTVGAGRNHQTDFELQREYAFSDFAQQNRWHNLFRDDRRLIAAIPDAVALAWIREDNYGPLRAHMAARSDFAGFKPDLDLDAGFDDDGFARDGSGWRAVRYKPMPGGFWPTNGSAGDVMIRLPPGFRAGARGAESRAVYKLNLALLEAAIAAPPAEVAPELALERAGREVEPVDESLAGFDLDGDGRVGGTITVIRRLPPRYAGGAAEVPLVQWSYPPGTELFHTVRYVDPEAPGLLARRLKEVRYARKVRALDDWGLVRAYEREVNEKEEGRLPLFAGDPMLGLMNELGWQLSGYIEDAEGRLRVQTQEETLFCMGCHSNLGVTVDQTFSFARKLPGAAGWRHQDLAGMPDAPQAGHRDPEALLYMRRVGAGDDLRANGEMIARWFPGGRLDEAAVRRAAPGGDRDLAWLLAPSRERALALAKAYMLIVRRQAFRFGRDPVLAPAANVHESVSNGDAPLGAAGTAFLDGRAWLDWGTGSRVITSR